MERINIPELLKNKDFYYIMIILYYGLEKYERFNLYRK